MDVTLTELKTRLWSARGPRLVAAVVCALAAAGGASAQISHSLNLPESLVGVKTAMMSGDQADILVIGDSLTYGPNGWLPVFRAALQATYSSAGAGYRGFMDRNGMVFSAPWGGGIADDDPAPHRGLDGIWSVSPPSGLPAPTATFTTYGTKVQLHFARMPEGGDFHLRRLWDNSLLATLSCNSPVEALGTWEYTFPGADRAIRVEPVGPAPVTLLGILDTVAAPGVRVHRVANGGWGVQTFLQRDWTFDAQMSEIDPHLVMIWLGANDNLLSPEEYAEKMGLLVDRIRASSPGASIVLISTYDQGSTQLASFAAALRAEALDKGTGFIDLFNAAGYSQYFADNVYTSDGVHFNAAGGQYMGTIMIDAFMSEGESLVTTIADHPRSQRSSLGIPVSFTAAAASNLQSVSYHWRKNGELLADGGSYQGVTTAELTILCLSLEDAARYSVDVTSELGVDTSRFGTLRLFGLPMCVGDADGNARVDFEDITSVLTNWGFDYVVSSFGSGPGDADLDSIVDFDDIVAVIVNWSFECP